MMDPVLILNRRDVASLMRPEDYLKAVEAGFRAAQEGRAASPPPMHIPGEGGAFHGKGAAYADDNAYVALKLNGNFPDNPARFDLPCIQGAIFLCNARNGAVLAILDSIEITLRRTAAASALAALHLAREDAHTLCICGCGAQGLVQAEALSAIRPFERCFVWDIDQAKAQSFASALTGAQGMNVEAVSDFGAATRQSDVIVTCTTAREAFLYAGDVRPGAFIAAVGADSPHKNEIAPDLMASATVVVDVREQCVEMGDLRAAIEAGPMTLAGVHAELGEIVTGQRPGRTSREEIFVFDSTGTALQDVASAALAYERAIETGAGLKMELGRL
jgi:ornithine cyclodeaminase/alanine dehydrogenase-like protein (mu-crystallin family)